MQKAGFDIERGEVNSEAVHHTVKQYKADIEKEKAELTSEQSMSQRLTLKMLEAEVRELRNFKQMAEKFLAEHGLKDYFRKAFIYFNNRDIKYNGFHTNEH